MTRDGIARLLERLGAARPALVVLEATGGYEGELLAALIAPESKRGESIRARYVTSPRLEDDWPRPIGSTPSAGPVRRAHPAAGARLARPRARATQGAGRPAAASCCRC